MKRILTLFFLMLCAWCAVGGPLDSQLPISGPRGGGVKLPLQNPMTTDISSYDFNASNSAEKQIITTTPSSSNITYSSSASDVIQISTTGKMTPYLATGSTIITVSQPASAYFKSKEITIPVTSSVLGWQAANTCLYLDGSDDHVLIPGVWSSRTAQTIMFWFKDLDTSKKGSILAWDGGGRGYNIDFIVPNYIKFGTGYGWIQFQIQRNNEWRNLAISIPSYPASWSSCGIYLDGEPMTGGVVGGDGIVKIVDVGIGRGYFPHPYDYKIKMKLAEFAIWNKALTQEEVRSAIRKRLVGNEPNLDRLYHFDDGSGTSVLDYSYGYNATLYNGATWTARP